MPSGRLQQNPSAEARRSSVDLPQRPRHLRQPCFLTRTHVRARMEHQPRDLQRLAPLQFDDEHIAGLRPQHVVVRAQVEQVGAMAYHRADTRLLGPRLETHDVLLGQRLHRPGAIRLYEDLYCLTAHRTGAIERLVHPASDGLVGS